jgi:dTDP-4-amino-4,6-dideoxygalactose transaminase|tara:strand:- start:348 stop:1445 length:1098 start_codon:yes stop_codon:yes gene_type:complete
MKIPYVNLPLQWKNEKKRLMKIIEKTLSKGEYVNPYSLETKIFEKKVSKLCGTKYAVALSSGTDALTLGLYLLGVKKGDEVITPPNSFISSTSVITHIGAKPVFVDVLDDQNINPDLIESAITKKTKAIMPVHLTGRICEMKKIKSISEKYNIPIIEDAAQSIGSKYYGKPAGSFGQIGCFSTHPLKNLNAIGDGGFLTTNDKNIFNKAKTFSNHGLANRNLVKHFSFLSRMDVIQSAVLNFRLQNLKYIISARRKNAEFYLKNLNRARYFFKNEKPYEFNTYHTFVIQTKDRDKVANYLKKNNIGTAIHYPIPLHLQPAAKYLGYKKGDFPKTEKQSKEILTIPIHQYLTKKELRKVVDTLNKI